MNNEDNPYLNLIEIMREQSNTNKKDAFVLGFIQSTNPLRIKASDLILEEEDLMVNANIGDFRYFEVGQRVVLLTDIEKEQFILLCKVR